MKHLNVNWLPETFAIISLTVVPASGASLPQSCEGAPDSISFPRTKLIVISGQGKLKADVRTALGEPAPRGSMVAGNFFQ